MPDTTPLRYPPASETDDLDPIITDLEEGWSRERVEQWPIEKAMRICPVFRHITGRAG